MEKKIKKISVVKATVLAIVLGGVVSQRALSGIPTIDIGTIGQTTISATQQVLAVKKQVEQFATQVQQYEKQVEQYKIMYNNALKLENYTWDKAQSTMQSLMQAQNTLAQYKTKLGSLEKYLERYQTLASYLKSPCFTSAGCSASERQKILDAQAEASQAQKLVNDDVLKGIDQQQKSLSTEATRLTQLQTQAQGAKGQMQAIQATNQLASTQVNQMQQIRALLMAQQTAEATRNQVIADREAQEMAASRQLRNSANIQVDNKPATLSWGK
ncbi:P-type conjugative transfer protein TrbJ [Candidatus Regiella insecticola]|uniref:Putative conjugal transfer protein n=1 Tax=Candidatus Regiella insecticola TaxID=138073 RepID=A0A6L2ZQK8_9ENTR|nr:P-type conjugative transfer protein TrbJ [Candidatus Regiella insecticola]GFN46665.1 putative conjugal transfer protein [Candidatus Regiella insecticola]